jgi:hypothetical protein
MPGVDVGLRVTPALRREQAAATAEQGAAGVAEQEDLAETVEQGAQAAQGAGGRDGSCMGRLEAGKASVGFMSYRRRVG